MKNQIYFQRKSVLSTNFTKAAFYLFLFLSATVFTSCSKTKDTYDPGVNDHNEIHATVTFASGIIRNMDLVGPGASMGCATYTGT